MEHIYNINDMENGIIEKVTVHHTNGVTTLFITLEEADYL